VTNDDQPLVAVLDYGIGNLRSAQKALERVGANAQLTSDHGLIADADAVVLPGVGAFGACMTALRDQGLDEVAVAATSDGRPFLGVCVGMQMLYEGSDESPGATGLGVLPGRLRLLPDTVKRPQMQWNQLDVIYPDNMFEGLGQKPWMYFVHSLHGVPDDNTHVAATVQYGEQLNVAFRKDNVFATQFHPEKSAGAGLALLQNFVSMAVSS
jgi:glutamine amidotransferase